MGANTGRVVALNMVIELLRLALNTSITTVALGQLATGMAALGDLLPSLRSDRMAALPPSDRLAFVAKEVQLWRQSERTSSRSGGGSSVGGTSAPDSEVAKLGAVGYPAMYQADLRRLLASDAYAEAADAVKSALDNEHHNEAITIIFGAGLLPLLHALIKP